MRIGSLFSGGAGLDRAVEAVFGGEVVWFSEIDKAASKVLAHRFPGVPNLGSITDIDWATVEPVDVLCGGFPCQDVSAAGKRAGIKDGTRSGLWAVFADAIDALRPQYVIIENVRGLLSATAHRAVESDDAVVGDRSDRPVLRAIGAVLGDLSDLGYDSRWATIAAASVGAPHRRERVFIVGTASHTGHDAGCPEHGFEHEKQTRRVGQSSDRNRVASLAGSAAVGQHAGGASTPETWAHSGDRSGDHRGERTDEVALLPTPQAFDQVDYVRTPEQLAEQAMRPNGGGARNLREVIVNELPEPTLLSTHAGGNLTLQGAVVGVKRNTLPLNAEVTLLPTPRTSDTNGAGHHGDGGMDLRTTVTLRPTPRVRHGDSSESGLRRNSPGIEAVTCHFPDQQWGKYAPAIARWEQIVGPAPAPTEPNKNNNPRLSAAFSEWLMGWPAGWVTDPAIGISRNDQLRIVGNGVCTQQAIAALRYLLAVTA